MYDRTIQWSDLPHENYVGNGREGLVLRLNETESIKIYSPERAYAAKQAIDNARFLRKLGFLVPEPKEFVKVELNPESRLPVFTTLQKARMFPVRKEVKSVPAVVKEYFDGKAFGSFKPNWKELRSLGKYLDKLDECGLSFYEGISLDFIALTDGRVGLVDCTTLVEREGYQMENHRGLHFDELSLEYQSRIYESLKHDLELNGCLDTFTSTRLIWHNLARTII